MIDLHPSLLPYLHERPERLRQEARSASLVAAARRQRKADAAAAEASARSTRPGFSWEHAPRPGARRPRFMSLLGKSR